jgi:eukaryotic-like serine/threonine-protein kinase
MNSESGKQRWVICPVCHKPNPAGTLYCKHCWGAALPSDKSLTSEELQDAIDNQQSTHKHRHLIKLAILILVPLMIVAGLVVYILYASTDTFSHPSPTLSSSSHLGEWAMFRRDLLRTAATSSDDIHPQGQIAWTFTTDGALLSSPAVADGRVYFGSRDGKFYALDAVDGAKLWEFQTGSWIESSPAIAGGIVYCGSNDGNLYALKADTGERIWNFQTSYPVVSTPAIAGEMVYFGSDNYSLYALDAVTGEERWEFKTGGRVQSSPVIANGIVYFGSSEEYFYALNALNGKLRLNFKTLDSVYSSPTVSDQKIYFGNSSGFFYAIDGNARTWPGEYKIKQIWLQLWAMGLAPEPSVQSGSIWNVKLGESIESSAAVVDATAYVGVDRNLTAVDLKKGDVLWKFATGGPVKSSPALAGNSLFFGSDDGKVYAVDAVNGEKLWDIETGDKISSSPVISNGILYIGSYDGILYAIK